MVRALLDCEQHSVILHIKMYAAFGMVVSHNKPGDKELSIYGYLNNDNVDSIHVLPCSGQYKCF